MAARKQNSNVTHDLYLNWYFKCCIDLNEFQSFVNSSKTVEF